MNVVLFLYCVVSVTKGKGKLTDLKEKFELSFSVRCVCVYLHTSLMQFQTRQNWKSRDSVITEIHDDDDDGHTKWDVCVGMHTVATALI